MLYKSIKKIVSSRIKVPKLHKKAIFILRDFKRNIGNVFFRTPKEIRYALYSVTGTLVLFILLDVLFPFRPDIEYSTLVLSKNGEVLHGFLTSDDKWRMYVELEEITPELKKAIIFKEDKHFYRHFGVNPVSIVRAFIQNITTGERKSGASTITMQVARMLEPKKRNYLNKVIEIFRAIQLEWHYSKEEILQLYCNLVPYGSNIEGMKSASLLYFDKMPNHLSLAEITTLSIIPNRPVSLRLGKSNNDILKERNKWLYRFKNKNLFDHIAIKDAREEPLTAYRHELSRYAPHLSIRLKNELPGISNIHSTIDLEIQKKTEKLVSDHIKTQYYQNIRNACALVIDNKTKRVLAYVGSADFYNDEDGGQVDGIQAVRSPGSTLKPFLYALAFDKGLYTPKSIITDVPTSFYGYEPENYNGEFYGNVSLEYALINSLNVPAVKVLNNFKVRHFIYELIKTRFRQIENDKDALGLSTILGGCGVTLEEMTALYTGFAGHGIYSGIKMHCADTTTDTLSFLSPSATYMITEILTNLARPDLPVQWQQSTYIPKIAWKTGTSYGRRDAWSIGYNKNYTIGVWVGNFSGEGVAELSGSEKAAPLLFNLFNAIDHYQKKEWFTVPEELSMRYVCAETGKLPNTYCTNLIIDYYIPGISPTVTCNHLKKVFISPDSTVSYCSACLPESGYIEAYYPNLKPEIVRFYDENFIDYKKIPAHNPECEKLFTENAPVITSPIHSNEYFIDKIDTMEIMLSCDAANDANMVYWYINQQYFKSCKPRERIFFKPSEGEIHISCSDDKGRNTDIVINVKYITY